MLAEGYMAIVILQSCRAAFQSLQHQGRLSLQVRSEHLLAGLDAEICAHHILYPLVGFLVL